MIAAVYGWADYLIATLIVGGFLVWIAAEVLGIVGALHRLMARMSGQTPASAEEAAQRVTEAAYAATRNARQDLTRGGRHGKTK